MFFLEFGDTAFVARDPGRGEIAGYLLGFVAPSSDGYIHEMIRVEDYGGSGRTRIVMRKPLL